MLYDKNFTAFLVEKSLCYPIAPQSKSIVYFCSFETKKCNFCKIRKVQNI